jgi:peroxiredoxin (alkyl hydroperoxide reductase subunit C)
MEFENYCEVNEPLVGSNLPDIEFEVYQDEEIKKVKISDYKGKWLILFFYPADFTFVCPTELEEMADNYEAFKKEGAEIISVSTDTVFVHKAWHDTSDAIKKIKYPMAADPTGNLSRALGVYIEKEGIALRGSFIVNPEGKIVLAEVNDNSIGRNAKELLRKLQAAKFVSEHDGQVCPASWTPGSDTLEPGLDLVGKI